MITQGQHLFEVIDDDIKNGTFTMPDEINMIDAYCFSELHDLHSIIIPKQILGIDEAAFYDCQSLECIVFECESCKFGADVFSWCENLRDVVLPRNQQRFQEGFLNIAIICRQFTSQITFVKLNHMLLHIVNDFET